MRTLGFAARCLVVGIALGFAAEAAEAGKPRVYVVLIDGLDARVVSADATPALWQLSRSGTFYPRGRAVMPTVTNTNHVSIVTGAYPEAHGITGNRYWNGTKVAALDSGDLIEVETLFTVARTSRKPIRTAGIFGKTKLAELFGEAGTQRSPHHVWADRQTESEDESKHRGSDRRTMDEMLRTIAAEDPDFVFVNLGDVDRRSHVVGPRSPEVREAIAEADRQIERLVAFLKERRLWRHVVLMLTSDHGFTPIDRSHEPRNPVISFGEALTRAGFEEFVAVASGRTEYLYARDSTPRAGERLKALRALALHQPGIAEALYRLPQPADGGESHRVDRVHPDWRLGHERAGEIVLVAGPGHVFVDPFNPFALETRGSHGGPA
ncbi:MAG: alkaline phosphatase family protein, partial [Candidatus Binatia bacterium]